MFLNRLGCNPWKRLFFDVFFYIFSTVFYIAFFCFLFFFCLRFFSFLVKNFFQGSCGKNMLDVCCDLTPYDEYVAVVRARNECQPTAYMSSHGKFCHSSLLRENVVQAKFLLVSLLNTLLAEPESDNALVAIWSGERRTPRITRRDTYETCGHSTPQDSRLSHHPSMDCLIMCCRRPVACTTRHEHLSTHSAHGSGAVGYSALMVS